MSIQVLIYSKSQVYIPEDFDVRYGYFDDRYAGDTMEVINHSFRRILRHPECYNMHNRYSSEYDIAVIQVNVMVKWSKYGEYW